jgi:hypothetical protein
MVSESKICGEPDQTTAGPENPSARDPRWVSLMSLNNEIQDHLPNPTLIPKPSKIGDIIHISRSVAYHKCFQKNN